MVSCVIQVSHRSSADKSDMWRKYLLDFDHCPVGHELFLRANGAMQMSTNHFRSQADLRMLRLQFSNWQMSVDTKTTIQETRSLYIARTPTYYSVRRTLSRQITSIKHNFADNISSWGPITSKVYEQFSNPNITTYPENRHIHKKQHISWDSETENNVRTDKIKVSYSKLCKDGGGILWRMEQHKMKIEGRDSHDKWP